MERDIAIKLDGMVHGVNAILDGLAHFMKNNLSPEEYAERSIFVGEAMGAMFEISSSLYAIFSDILPKELQPPVK
jgi:hypothetical protein